MKRWLCFGMALVGMMAYASSPLAVQGRYAIVAEAAVMDEPAWRKAVEALQEKYPQAKVLTFKHHPEEVREALAKNLPRYTAVVVKPDTANALFVMQLATFFRTLDDDPWVDSFWGIITGYDAASAERLAAAQSIAIRRALDCAGMELTVFDEAWRYSEDTRGVETFWHKGNGAPEKRDCSPDNTQAVLARLQKDSVQFLTTSGHATERNWDMGYCGPNMWLSHAEGQLIAIDTRKQPYFAHSDEPKVYIATGNCLIGNIDKPDCMALSWIKDGGVRQMVGYVVTTWFGAQGWGTMGNFVNQAGLYTANEAFHFVNTEIVQALQKAEATLGITDLQAYRWREVKQVNFPMTPQLSAWAMKQTEAQYPLDNGDEAAFKERMRQIIGNLHDRDSVTFLGDPALNARIANERFTVTPWKRTGNTLSCTVTFNEAVTDAPIWVALPGSFSYGEVTPKPRFCVDNMLQFSKMNRVAGTSMTILIRDVEQK